MSWVNTVSTVSGLWQRRPRKGGLIPSRSKVNFAPPTLSCELKREGVKISTHMYLAPRLGMNGFMSTFLHESLRHAQ